MTRIRRRALRRVCGVPIALALLFAQAAESVAKPGDLDAKFGRGGIVTGHRPQIPNSVAVDSRSRVVVTGVDVSQADDRIFVLRYSRDGSRDATFADAGTWASEGGYAALRAQIGPGDSVLVAGVDSRTGDGAVVRLTPDGRPDSTFGAGGIATFSEFGSVRDLAVLDDGRLYGVASAADADVAVFRLLADGALDPTFGDGGIRELPLSSAYGGPSIAAGPDGSIVVGGKGPNIAKLTPGGDLDPRFGSAGYLYAEPVCCATSVLRVAVRGDGAIVFVPISCSLIGPAAGCYSSVEVVTASGVRLATVGSSREDSIALTPDGGFFSAASRPAPFVLRRYNEGAEPKRGFGVEGRATAWAHTQAGTIEDLAVDTSGRPVALARIYRDGRLTKFAVARFSVSPGPRDADADGIRDPDDRCLAGFSDAGSGCRHFGRAVRLRELHDGRLAVRIRSPNSSCELDPKLSLFEAVSGRDRLVLRKRRSVFNAPQRAGRYYARAHRQFTALARCGAARSSVIHATPHNNDFWIRSAHVGSIFRRTSESGRCRSRRALSFG